MYIFSLPAHDQRLHRFVLIWWLLAGLLAGAASGLIMVTGVTPGTKMMVIVSILALESFIGKMICTSLTGIVSHRAVHLFLGAFWYTRFIGVWVSLAGTALLAASFLPAIAFIFAGGLLGMLYMFASGQLFPQMLWRSLLLSFGGGVVATAIGVVCWLVLSVFASYSVTGAIAGAVAGTIAGIGTRYILRWLDVDPYMGTMDIQKNSEVRNRWLRTSIVGNIAKYLLSAILLIGVMILIMLWESEGFPSSPLDDLIVQTIFRVGLFLAIIMLIMRRGR